MIPKILLVEDEADIRTYLQQILIEQDFSVQVASDGTSALTMVKKSPPDLVLLDLGLPNMRGEDVCRELRKMYPLLPIIILTAKDTTEDIVNGLKLGSDDYITKPFSVDELIARISARLRVTKASDKLQIADLLLDEKTFQVTRNQKPIILTPREFHLLHYLLLNKNRVLTREMILNRVWQFSDEVDTRVVDIYIGYLRKKIDANGQKPLIHTIRGVGFVLKE